MSTLLFRKMHGCANDYVVVDADAQELGDASAWARALCDRRRGVGADGLLLVGAAEAGSFRMRMFNPDGSEAEMCGNGLRCAVRFARETQGAGPVGTVQTQAGLLAYEAHDPSAPIRVSLGAPRGTFREATAMTVDGDTMLLHLVTLGNPHAVCFVDNVDAVDLASLGPKVEHHEAFPNRTNFEVAQVVDRAHVRQRTWERGAGETLACGTGAGAVCVAAAASLRTESNIEVELRGGVLQASWDPEAGVHLTGPAVTVFEGQWTLELDA